MIALINGTIAARTLDTVIVDVAGVGYELSIPSGTPLATVGSAIRLHTYLHVREDALNLYGFADATTKDVFVMLISASGVGPKLALTILSTLTSEVVITALRARDTQTLTQVPGIGKKVAERLVLELCDKAGSLAVTATLPAAVPSTETQMLSDVHDALVALGYSTPEADRAIAHIDAVHMTDPSQLLRAALTTLTATKAT